jgi:hypothetical protein
MSDGFTVDTGTLRNDGELWGGWGTSLSDGAATISSSFEYWAFSDQPGFEALRDQYFAAAADLRDKVTDGGAVMGDIAARLKLIASIYEEAEEDNRSDIQGA